MLELLDPRRVLDPRGVRWRDVDWHVLLVALLLVAIGLVLQAEMAAAEPAGVSGGVDYAGHREKLLVTAPLLALALMLRPSWLRSAASWLFAASVVLLVAVPVGWSATTRAADPAAALRPPAVRARGWGSSSLATSTRRQPEEARRSRCWRCSCPWVSWPRSRTWARR